MSAPEQRRAAARANAQKSTGPITTAGKAAASRNAVRHGVLSEKLLLDGEPTSEFEALIAGLAQSLNPVGVLETSIVERIAITLWRQRRLVQSETAALSLSREAKQLAARVSSELGRSYGREVQPEDLAPFDGQQLEWCRAVIAELEDLDAIDIQHLESRAPLAFEQLQSDADEVTSLQAFLSSHDGGLMGYLGELLLWCRGKLKDGAERPHVLELAKRVADVRLVLPAESLELMGRYQSTLDNQLYKALRMLRDAQEWRLKTLEGATATSELEGISAAV